MLALEISSDRKRLITNFTSLTMLQVANYIFPLITVPYLVRILGPEKFGLLAFALALIQYFVIFTDYGFNLSATRKISIHRENKERVSQVFNSVMTIKLIFTVLSFIVLTLIVFSIPKFKLEWQIYLFSFGIVAGGALFPVWLFQGLEKMRYITMLNILARLLFTVAVFIFIKSKADYLYVPVFNSLGSIVAGAVSLYIALRQFDIKLKIMPVEPMVEELKDGWHIFVSTVAISLYTITNPFVLGLLANNTAVGYYSAADKLIKAVQGLLGPVSQTIYPHMSKLASESRDRAVAFMKKTTKVVGGFSFVVSLVVFIFATPIANFILGSQFKESIVTLRIFAFLPFLIALSNIFGVQGLFAFGYSKVVARIQLQIGILGVLMTVILTMLFKEKGTALSLTITELLITVVFYFESLRCRIWSLSLEGINND